uniref:Exostosin GT47 domain-containing protein n=1 Tax=Oryza brachyantha TaxID=4533 RepID=J3N362_ORYBR
MADKPGGGAGFLRPSRVCYLAVISTAFWSMVFYAHHSAMQGGTPMAAVLVRPSAFSRPLLTSFRIIAGGQDRCAGRRVYMYEMPARFNAELVRDCGMYSTSMDVCKLVVNGGFGPALPGGGALPERDVYDTDQYMLELIYHARMRRYECLAGDASAADAANPWKGVDFGVPFPSHFHPTSDADVLQWQDCMRRRDRRWLWAFAGAPRPGSSMTVRAQIIEQCTASPSCTHFGSSPGHYNSPGRIMELLESATFCIQPRGDSYTRKSTFDSMLAGCIPVFLHPASAYTQYTWHLPRDYRTYSVFIPHTDVAGRNASIDERLRSIPPATVARMREEVIRLIPRITYRDPAATRVTFRDAFDVAVDAVLDRVAAAEGREYVDVFDGHDSWKHNLLEDGQTQIGPHEFDPYL